MYAMYLFLPNKNTIIIISPTSLLTNLTMDQFLSQTVANSVCMVQNNHYLIYPYFHSYPSLITVAIFLKSL